MEPTLGLARPNTFEEGGEYYWLEPEAGGFEASVVPVTFTAYDTCPAFVIVSTDMGKKWRCLRENVLSVTTTASI